MNHMKPRHAQAGTIARTSAMLAVFAAASVLGLASCAGTATRTGTASELDRIIASSHRSDANRARDKYRHPRETLLFFGLRPDQTVVEILPIGAWYTEIIAPLVRDHGSYIAAMPPVAEGNANSENSRKAYTDLLARAPGHLDRVTVVDFDLRKDTMIPDGSADMVLTFRNIHNWMRGGQAQIAFLQMYRALKPGGTLGVVEHRGKESVPQDPQARSGYVNQSYAIKLIEGAGFKLVATSEINSNPKDTKDYASGVWTLPPTLAAGEVDRAKYLAIGESDRFTLKFVKPR
jgi:predicted methyltransferase